MTKLCKKLIMTGLVALCVAAFMCLFVGCSNVKPEDNAVAYSVTVQTDDTTPASGVRVQIRKGGATFESKNTDENGKAEFELAPDSYDVALSSLPARYSVPEGASLSLTAESRDLTVTLVKNFAYTVKLVDTNGDPYYAEGVTVGVCTFEGNCLQPVLLEENGVATIEVDKGNYHVKVNDLPANAIIECDADGYYTGKNFSAEDTEMTITVYTINSVTAATPMTDAEKTAFAQGMYYTLDSKLTAYHFEENLAAEATAYYSITPEFDGDYRILYKNGNASNFIFNGTAFTLSNNQGNAMFAFPHTEAGKTYYFNVRNTNKTPLKLEFVIESPAASYTEIKLVGEVEVTIAKEGACAVIEYAPAIGAAFKVTGPSDFNTSIQQSESAYSEVTHETFVKDAVCTARFTEDLKGRSLYFSVAVDGVTQYPVTFTVKVEKTADLKNTTNVKRATATLSQYGEQEGTLTDVPVDGTATVVYNATDKFYHLNSEDGPVVVVFLTKSLANGRFSTFDGSSLVYIDKADGGRYSLILDTTSDKTSLTYGNTYDDYRIMLRGFADYNYKPNSSGGYDAEIPTNITEEHYYAKYVNNDGVYPLTEELKVFLQAMAAAYPNNVPESAAEGSEWLFACKYYAEEIKPPVIADVIVGEYVFESMGGSQKLTVNADGTYKMFDGFGTVGGTWVKTAENVYAFTEVIEGWDPLTYAVKRDAETGALAFYNTENDPDMEFPEYEYEVPAPDPVIGEYIFESRAGSQKLTVNADGTYEIFDGFGTIGGTWEKTAENVYAFTEVIEGWDPLTYAVKRDAETGALAFYNTENDPDMEFPEYEFDVNTKA